MRFLFPLPYPYPPFSPSIIPALASCLADRRPRFQRGGPRGPRRPRQPPGQDSQGEERGPSDGELVPKTLVLFKDLTSINV